MKTKKSTIGLVALVFVGGAFFARWASAEDAPFGSVAAVVDAGEEDGGGADAEPGLAVAPKLTLSLSSDKSPRPGNDEWEHMPLQSFSPGSSANGCTLQWIREWVRIRCTTSTAQIALLGGQHDGVSIKLDPVAADEFVPFPQGGEIVFPLRPGDRRVFEWLGIEFGYKGMTSAAPFLIISASWPREDEGPMIFAR